MNNENWKPVIGWELLYEVSDAGRVRSLDRIVQSPGAKCGYPRRIPGRILSPGRTGKARKYLFVHLKDADSRRVITAYVAHLVAQAFIGERPDGLEICHNDGDSFNNHASNLRCDTHENNEADKLKHGTTAKGENCRSAVLTVEDIRMIRRLSVEMDHGLIAKIYSVTVSNIDQIANRRTWRHVPPDDGEVGTEAGNKAKQSSIRQWRIGGGGTQRSTKRGQELFDTITAVLMERADG